ncbi:MAG: serine/threonine-protein kinase, partial [Polyangiales bacterium]
MVGTERRQRIFDVGELLCGTYEVGEVLGQGGMGQVLAAFDRSLHRKIAIKASWPHVDRSLLRAEAQALAALRHPNMLTVYALCEHDAVPFLAMERIFGIELRAHLSRRAREGLAISPREAIDLLLPVAESLAAMHAAGLAHRDVKPANVMLTVGGRI